MIFRALLIMISLVLLPSTAQADDMRPGYLEVRETAPSRYVINWKAPAKVGKVAPTFPADCVATGEAKRSFETAALLVRWTIVCKQSLAGREVLLAGLGSTQGEA